jgi:hypothetical protein
MEKKDFKVFGDEALLKDCKINIYKIKEGSEKMESLLFDTKLYDVTSTNDDIKYIIYLSYKDLIVGKINYENILKGEENQINHFYISKNKEIVSVKFVGKEEFLKSNDGFVEVLIPINEYLGINNIHDEKLILKEKNIFFDYYKR